MTYIFLVAGKGIRLHPLTFNHPKSLYKLDKNTSVLQRMINLIRSYDNEANIVIVTGFMSCKIERSVNEVVFIKNPFYAITNSIASLWFARNYLDGDVVIINGDIVVSSKLIKDIIVNPIEVPTVLIDSSIKSQGDYNVQVNDERVVVMSKEITEYYGEYAGITKLEKNSSKTLREEIDLMINEGFTDQWYENALVQLIFRDDFRLSYVDISEYDWTEIDSANDLIKAQTIHRQDLSNNY